MRGGLGKFARFGALMDQAFASFIERRFIEELLISETYSFEPADCPPPSVARDHLGIELGFQVPVGPYRLDFALWHPATDKRLAIELDGYAWHRRSPEEAEDEARRERYIVASGWTVARYMGGEVVRSPRSVVQHAYGLFAAWVPRGPGLAKTTIAATSSADGTLSLFAHAAPSAFGV
jgi:very-short-patch-repair endonuclease